jgi:hypothetical protein
MQLQFSNKPINNQEQFAVLFGNCISRNEPSYHSTRNTESPPSK